jgi:CheY-like chemotaxis protein
MSAKRALVVDDSKSARAFLSRILERHNLVVDGAESAEDAIDYLTRQRPDVIFMDHLMPGMDGFQAVRTIKSDPRTATIPILMYTSQEGELYLSQARALGALGVLPKQTRPVDVTKALLQLHLVDAEPGTGTVTTRALARPNIPDSEAPTMLAPTLRPEPSDTLPQGTQLSPELRELITSMLHDQSGEMRRFVLETLDSHAHRIVGSMRQALHDTQPAPPSAPPPVRSSLPWIVAGCVLGGLIIAAVLATLGDRAIEQQRLLDDRLALVQSTLAAANRRDNQAQQAIDVARAPGAPPPALMTETVPYGELPLGGARIDKVRGQIEQLLAQGFRGRVEIRSFPGRFCLAGSGADASLPESASAYVKCTEVSEAQLAASAGQRESVAFANMLAALRKRAGDALQVQIIPGSVNDTAVAYPAATDGLTAGEWNHAAAQNNRIEVRWLATP